tara:strand:- start:2561 stop:2995 length:435 start_codon:yes stop_codon:yes gene_type:complete
MTIMKIPLITEVLSKNAESFSRPIGPIMPIEECEHKWELHNYETGRDLYEDGYYYWGLYTYTCNRCGSIAGIDAEESEELEKCHYFNKLQSFELSRVSELELKISVLENLLFNHEPFHNSEITKLMVEEYEKKSNFLGKWNHPY